jgi:hypothetical protein
MKPLIDTDLLVLDDLFLRRKIATESADELQAILHRRYSIDFCIDIPVEFRGRSYRLKEASTRLVNAEESA